MLSRNQLLQQRYRIIRALGKGGFGQVYEAMDDKLDCIVAIKERLAKLDSEKMRRAFEKEAKLLANLRHPVLPKVMDHFFAGEGQYLVMEFIEGDDLARLLSKWKHPFTFEQVLTWADELLKALTYLHTRYEVILHRDIKPGNIKLTNEGEIFLLDFGLAKGYAGEMPVPETGHQSSSIHGYTEAYAPLEQLNNSGTNEQSDLYALGATLYHLLTGRAPITAAQRYKSMEMSGRDPLPPVCEINQTIPPPVSLVISQAMAMSRRERLRSAAEMHQALIAARREIVETKTYSPSSDRPSPRQGGRPARTPLPTVPSPTAQSPTPFSDRTPAPESQPGNEVSWPSQVNSEVGDSSWASTVVDPELRDEEEHAPSDEAAAREVAESLERRSREEESERQRLAEVERRETEEKRLREEAEERQRAAAEQERLKAEEEARRRAAEEEAVRRAEEAARQKAEEEAARLRAEEEARQRAAEQAHLAAAEQARRQAEEEARLAAEAEAQRQAEEEARLAAEAEARRKAEEEAARLRAQEEARLRAEEEARRAEEERLRLEEEERQRAAAEAARIRAEEEAERLRAEEEARLAAEEEARQRALDEERLRAEAEARLRDEEAARKRAAEQARLQAAFEQQEEFNRRQTRELSSAETSRLSASQVEAERDARPSTTVAPQYQPSTIAADPQIYMPRAALQPFPKTQRNFKLIIVACVIAVVLLGVAMLALFRFKGSGVTPAGNANQTVNANQPQGGTAAAPLEFSLKQSIGGQGGTVWSVAFSPDGTQAASAGDNRTVSVWDTKSWRLKFELKGHGDIINSVAFSPDGRLIASGSKDQTIRLWNTADGGQAGLLRGHGSQILSVAFSPRGKILASASADRTIKLWDSETGEAVAALEGHTDEVWSIAFSPDGQTLVSAGRDNTIRIWDVASRKEKNKLPAGKVFSLALSSDGETLASGHDNKIKLWNLKTGEGVKTLAEHTAYISFLAFTRDGATLASASNDGQIKLWEIRSGQLKQTLAKDKKGVETLSFSPDGKTLLSGGRDQDIKIWQ